jgi:acrylyl-CoA reductase (NADPH)
VRLPGSLSPARAAAIGTAGFTAMLSVLALEDQGVAAGSVAVTGSTGGVGSIAVAVLAARGYEVTALTGRVAEHGELLTRLGAAHVVDRSEVSEPGRPLQTARWAGAVDAVGGVTLANLIAQTERGGTVTACGLAQSPELPASVLPFILRGVKLVGIDSVEASPELRERAWSALAAELDLGLLDELTTTIGLDAVPGAADALLAGRMSGRTVVEVNRLAE